MISLFMQHPDEFLKVKYLIMVKMKRGMTEDEALHETLQQRYFEGLSISYIDDMYVAVNLMVKDYPEIKKIGSQIMIEMGREMMGRSL